MIIVCYDIANDKVRTQFAKFLQKYGRRLQYSVFEIKNSKRVLDIVKLQIKEKFEPKFSYSDSILIFGTSNEKILRFGYASHEESDLVYFED